MSSEVRGQVHSDESRGSLFLFAAAGVGIYIALRILDPLIAFPLRQISSTLATFFLNALSVPCTLSGTAISTANFTFDVNPDCSGSTSLRIMLTLGALWFGMYPNLTFGRRMVCLLLAAPIAVFFNAVRVTALVVLGDARAEPVEGFLHEVVGIGSFALAMGVVYLMTLLMAKEPSVQKRAGPRLHLTLLVMALVVCYLPLVWTSIRVIESWVEGVVRLSFVLVSAWLLARAARRFPAGRQVAPWIPCVFFVISLLVLAGGTMAYIETLVSLSLVGVLGSLFLYLRGWELVARSLPLFGVFFLGLPHFVHIKIGKVAERVGPEAQREVVGALLELILAGLLMVIYLWWTRPAPVGKEGLDRPRGKKVDSLLTAAPAKVLVFASLLGVLFQTIFNSGAATHDQNYRLEIPERVGDWTGTNLQPTEKELQAYGEEGIVSRIYERHGQDRIMLLASSSAGRRFSGHNPRSCMLGVGWTVRSEEKIVRERSSSEFSMMKLLLEREGERMEMRYWFDSDKGATALTTRELYLADVTRRLFGQRPDWRVYRVFGAPGSPSIDQFIDALTGPGGASSRLTP